MVWVRLAKDLHHASQCGLGAHAHVQRLHRQPPGIHADHRSNSRSQAAQSAAAAVGHDTLMVVAPRCNSIRISSAGAGVADAGIAKGKKCGGALAAGLLLAAAGMSAFDSGALPARVSASISHLRTMFAFRPLASATAAIDTPG